MAHLRVVPAGAETHLWRLPEGWGPEPRPYEAALPAPLSAQRFDLPAPLQAECGAAALHLALVDRGQGRIAPATTAMLIQAESLASALVNGSWPGARELASAEAGQPTTAAARAITRAAGALAAHLEACQRAVSLGAIAAGHSRPRRMASGKSVAQPYRRVQTWHGGSDLWPVGADYVPAHASRIPELMDDLVAFAAREDLDPVAQAAIIHAQVWAIQPFAEGNDRVATFLLHGVWRWRRVTTSTPVPIAGALLADRRRHASALRDFRDGDAGPIVALVAHHAARSAPRTADWLPALAALPETWRELSRPRAGSAAAALLPLLATHPIVDAAEVRRLTGASQASAYDAIQRLAGAGVLTRISPTRRETVWAALDVFQASIDLAAAVAGNGPASTPRQPPSTRAGAAASR